LRIVSLAIATERLGEMSKCYLFRWLFDMSSHVSSVADALLGKEHKISEAIFAWHEHRRDVYYAHLEEMPWL